MGINKNNYIRKIDDYIAIFFMAFLIVITMFFVFDAIEFLVTPRDYIRVYDLDTTKSYWQMQYLKKSILIVFSNIFIISIIFLSLKKPNKNIFILTRRILIVFFLIYLAWNYYTWSLTGFDH